MKKIYENKTGVTLTELLVATILMGIVMLGIVSVDFAIRQMSKKTSSTALLRMYTSAVMQEMSRNAALITGSSTGSPAPPDIGFLSFPALNPTRFYFRQDINAATGLPNNTPQNTSDDGWICYDKSQGGASAINIYKCRFSSPVLTNRDCFHAAAFGTIIIGTAVDNPPSQRLNMQFLPDNNVPTQKYYLEISLTNRKYPSSAASATNPEVSISTRVDLMSQSWILP